MDQGKQPGEGLLAFVFFSVRCSVCVGEFKVLPSTSLFIVRGMAQLVCLWGGTVCACVKMHLFPFRSTICGCVRSLFVTNACHFVNLF